jgi:hypothetical protein
MMADARRATSGLEVPAKETAMKIFALWLFLVLLAPTAPAATQERLEVEIIKFSCRQLPKAVEPKEMRDRDADPINDERALRGKSGLSNDVDTTHVSTTDLEAKKYDKERRDYSARQRPQDHEYKLEVKNSGAKKIVNLKWAYVFTDPVTQKQLVRHGFESKVGMKPGTQKKIVVCTDSSLPKVVNAQAQSSKGTPWMESVVIERVQYSDGTVWERP